jgi:hypothetical protein
MGLTSPQRAALEVVVRHGRARYSNATVDREDRPRVNARVVGPLEAAGLVEVHRRTPDGPLADDLVVVPTPAGIAYLNP